MNPTTAHITIRPCTFVDLSSINEIYNHYVLTSTATYQETPETQDERLTWFTSRSERYPVVVAEIENDVVGFACLNAFRTRSAYRFTSEHSLYVHHNFHRRGIGTALLVAILEEARCLGYSSLIGGIDSEQSASVALHKKHGFVEVGRFPRIAYKFNRWLDVVFVQKQLAPLLTPDVDVQ
jgi:phosphinothricin acetyltransferase